MTRREAERQCVPKVYAEVYECVCPFPTIASFVSGLSHSTTSLQMLWKLLLNRQHFITRYESHGCRSPVLLFFHDPINYLCSSAGDGIEVLHMQQ